jgi:GTP-binding protein HflX
MKKAILCAIILNDDRDSKKINNSFDELERLCNTAGAVCISKVIQKRTNYDPAYLIGYGKVLEIKDLAEKLKADIIVFNDVLKPIQQRNLEKVIGIKVIDRTRVILDIFALRARTKEGKLQVERAEIAYHLSRLAHKEVNLDSQTGGIGTRRGPGEKKIENDKRKLRDHIARLDLEILKIKQRRNIQRSNRTKSDSPEVAIVGYTNAGKSTLLSALSKSQVYADDKLFATLDPLTRKTKLPKGRNILLTDTVGFINKLPHDLIAAFRSTLEEILRASCILHIIDASSPYMNEQIETVLRVLKEIGTDNIPIITVYNKADKIDDFCKSALKSKLSCIISAKKLKGIDKLLELIEKTVEPKHLLKRLKLSYKSKNILNKIYDFSNVKKLKYSKKDIYISIECSPINWEKIQKILKEAQCLQEYL